LTGESELVQKSSGNFIVQEDNKQEIPFEEAVKHDADPFLISGSKVMEGNGQMLVCLVGANSNLGRYQLALADDAPEETPLQKKLADIAELIGKFGFGVAAATFGVLTLHLVYKGITEGNFFELETVKILFDYLIIAITIIVVAVPEGLPLAVTIALAYSLGQMKSENYLVKHMSSCEVMGGINNVCTDKTGTLTLNKMVVQELYIHKQFLKEVEFLRNTKSKAMKLLMEK
jgi:Ca2+ transporting ATPase